ncbi:MAG: outer membrane protein TolC [Cyclobacteriaceae bacterium]|jgi:outer membrane protein TolC
MNNRTILVSTLLLLAATITYGQELLSKQEAISLALESNFDIVRSNQSILIEENNTSIYNSGYLPTVNGTANINFNVENVTAEFQDGTERSLDRAKSNSRSAGLNVNWVLFDGFNRSYTMSLNQANYSVSQLNARATLEVVILDLFNSYYEVARTHKTVKSLKSNLNISKDRLLRVSYGFDYGQSTKLDITNALVDVNTDSINLLNAKQSLGNAHRNLNFLLARDANVSFEVDTTISFTKLAAKEVFEAKLVSNNTQILLAKSGIMVSDYNTRINTSRYLPTLAVDGNYNYRLGNNNSASFLAGSVNSGLSYGASLSWSLFDGGATKTAVQNAKINQFIEKASLQQAKQQAVLSFENAWSDYQNRLFVVSAQERNLSANENNFERTTEKFRLGQVTSLDFRVAQQNLLQAEINLIEARYNAKIAELAIYQLVGDIQVANF